MHRSLSSHLEFLGRIIKNGNKIIKRPETLDRLDNNNWCSC